MIRVQQQGRVSRVHKSGVPQSCNPLGWCCMWSYLRNCWCPSAFGYRWVWRLIFLRRIVEM